MSGSGAAEGGESCVTCSDHAAPARVLRLDERDLAQVRTESGGTEQISVALVAARVGDTVLVHAGEAIAVLALRAPFAVGRPAPEGGPR